MGVVNSATHDRIVAVLENELRATRRLSDDRTWCGPTADGLDRDLHRIGHLLRRMSVIALEVERHRINGLRF